MGGNLTLQDSQKEIVRIKNVQFYWFLEKSLKGQCKFVRETQSQLSAKKIKP